MKKGSFFANNKLPQIGEKVFFLKGFENKISSGKITGVWDIDKKGLSNTYADIIDIKGKKYHVNIDSIYDHFPKKVQLTDNFGEVEVWQ